jgi:hypothetical protein
MLLQTGHSIPLPVRDHNFLRKKLVLFTDTAYQREVAEEANS